MTTGFSKKTKWVSTDAWRGYNEPIYAVCGANDTGGWSDSPCPTSQSLSEIALAKKELRKHSIPTKIIMTNSSNVFCAHRYIITIPSKIHEARKIFAEWYEKEGRTQTTLLYAV